ncbi:MAG: PAS domain S-box protein, partial [Bacteroidales bacterium]|nr:PAS domain S-box protein [Bacteroidales bacterium]
RLLFTQFAVDNSRESNFWMDSNARFIYVNKAACMSLGYSQEELLNMSVHDIDPEFSADLWPGHWKELKEKSHLTVESQHRKKDGTLFPVTIVANLLEFMGRQYNCAFAINISQRKMDEIALLEHRKQLEETVAERAGEIEEKSKRLEESQKALSFLMEDVNDARRDVEKANKKLIEANKELESFSYSVSHDLKAPLRAIDGYAHAIIEDYHDKFDDEGKELLQLIHKNVKNMDQLIKDLLEFSRIGRTVLVISGINMKSLLNDVFMEIYQFIPDRKIQLKIIDFHPVKSDKRLLQQVILNLMTNALKFTANEKNAVIEAGSRIENDKIIYYLKDNGIGFDMKYIDKLFGVFQRLHSAEEYVGTGVGLALVQRIINRLGGRVWAEGKVGIGAIFYFALPVRKDI